MRLCIFPIFCAILGFSTAPRPASAGLIFCNNTGVTVDLAIGYYTRTPNFQGNSGPRKEYSSGWWKIEPGACALPAVTTGFLEERYVFYYARGGQLVWEGGSDDRPRDLCISNQKFRFSKDDNCSERKRFLTIDLGSIDDRQKTTTFNLSEARKAPDVAARRCLPRARGNLEEFTGCWMEEVATSKQKEILDCLDNTSNNVELALCAVDADVSDDALRLAGCTDQYLQDRKAATFAKCALPDQIGEQEEKLINCGIRHKDSFSEVLQCAGEVQLTPEKQRILSCVQDHHDDYKAAGTCIALTQLGREEQRIASCLMSNRGSYTQMGVCAAGDRLSLTPEQQVYLECAMSTGGEPSAFASCVGTRLTMNELEKCMTVGVGGSRGCFGENNAIRQYYEDRWNDVTKGPGPSNDLVGRDGAAVRTAVEISRRAQVAAEEATQRAIRLAREVEQLRLRQIREAEKSVEKLVRDPVGAVGDFGTQLFNGFR